MRIYDAIQALQQIASEEPDREVAVAFQCPDCEGRPMLTRSQSPGLAGSTERCESCNGTGWGPLATEDE